MLLLCPLANKYQKIPKKVPPQSTKKGTTKVPKKSTKRVPNKYQKRTTKVPSGSKHVDFTKKNKRKDHFAAVTF